MPIKVLAEMLAVDIRTPVFDDERQDQTHFVIERKSGEERIPQFIIRFRGNSLTDEVLLFRNPERVHGTLKVEYLSEEQVKKAAAKWMNNKLGGFHS